VTMEVDNNGKKSKSKINHLEKGGGTELQEVVVIEDDSFEIQTTDGEKISSDKKNKKKRERASSSSSEEMVSKEKSNKKVRHDHTPGSTSKYTELSTEEETEAKTPQRTTTPNSQNDSDTGKSFGSKPKVKNGSGARFFSYGRCVSVRKGSSRC